MKYCAKCGNPMEDDMMFCQKCGTKFEGVLATEKSDIDAKVAKMKKYNLILEASTFTWEYLREDGERAGNITVKQDKLCVELVDLITEILNEVSDDNKDFIEREVYCFVLNMGYKMCQEATKMLTNYSGFQELFNQGHALVQQGLLDALTFLNQMIDQDIPYKTTASLQSLHSSRIKAALDEKVIYDNLEYRKLTKQLAQEFNNMMSALFRRYIDFFASPGESYIETQWDLYNTILKGLPMAEVDSLDESCWEMALNDQEKNHNGGQFKSEFLKKRNQQRNAQRQMEKEAEDKKYWLLHPEEYKRVEVNKKQISEFLMSINTVDKEICSLENEKKPLYEKKANIESSIYDRRQKVEKLGRKLFGKKKAVEKIQVLNDEISKLNQEIQGICEEIKIVEKPISDKKLQKSNLEKEIRRLKQENVALRNK